MSRGHGHFVTLTKGHISLLSTFSKGFFFETISFEYYIQPLGKGGKKVYIFRPGHMT